MAIFQPRQRVRIVGCTQPKHRHLVGRQATVLGPCDALDGPGFDVAIDGEAARRDDGHLHNFKADHLAPIIPPHEAGQWSVIEALMPSLRDMRELA
jgi:hypothetical protein